MEPLEALRLFSGATAELPGLALPTEVSLGIPLPAAEAFPTHADAWDEALGRSQVADLLARVESGTETDVDPVAAQSGLRQLDRYLTRAWFSAGIDPQYHEDSTQAVYLSMLQTWGNVGFETRLADVGQQGIPRVFNRDTPDGPDFFRAIDAVKKRTQRLKTAQSLDDTGEVAAPLASGPNFYRDALEEAIARDLNPREADLIRATLRGETPMEIAQNWGLTPKTVSNEKTRVFQKLRESLSDLYDN